MLSRVIQFVKHLAKVSKDLISSALFIDKREYLSARDIPPLVLSATTSTANSFLKVLASIWLAKAIELVATSKDHYEAEFFGHGLFSLNPAELFFASVTAHAGTRYLPEITHNLANRVRLHILEQILERIVFKSQTLPYEQANSIEIQASIKSCLEDHAKTYSQSVSYIMEDSLPTLIDSGMGFVTIYSFSGGYTALGYLGYLALITWVNYLTTTQLSKENDKVEGKRGSFLTNYADITNKSETVLINNRSRFENNELDGMVKDLMREESILAQKRIALNFIANFLPTAADFGITIILASHRFKPTELDQFIFLFTYLRLLSATSVVSAKNIFLLRSSVTSKQKLNEFFDVPKRDARIENYQLDKMQLANPTIQYHDVSFSSDAHPESVHLHNISFEVNPGEIFAIVGISDSGKSMLVRLLERLYEPNHGKITINEIDIRTVPINILREKISLVSQNPGIFPKQSFFYNTLYGTKDESDLARAKRALPSPEPVKQAKGDIELLPLLSSSQAGSLFKTETMQAYNRVVALTEAHPISQGKTLEHLSSGERAKIGIARALLRNPDILILDSSSAALDAATQTAIIQKCREKYPHMTIIIADSHITPAIRSASQIIVLEHGRIVQKGTHKELKDTGTYGALWKTQTEENILSSRL